MSKLKIKNGFDIILVSEFLSRPINLKKISESEYDFYNDFFPFAFELVDKKDVDTEIDYIKSKKYNPKKNKTDKK